MTKHAACGQREAEQWKTWVMLAINVTLTFVVYQMNLLKCEIHWILSKDSIVFAMIVQTELRMLCSRMVVNRILWRSVHKLPGRLLISSQIQTYPTVLSKSLNKFCIKKFSNTEATTLDEKTYELLVDEHLDILSEQLETYLETLDDKSYDITFNVSLCLLFFQANDFNVSGWCAYHATRVTWNLCHK